MNPLISVIVPIYNTEKYLRECIESIQRQTYSNLEIILVDDESIDHCPAICDELALKDHRIKVIHKENGGAADARNVGTLQANGEYIIYIDSDDWIHIDMFQILYEALRKTGAQAASCEYQTDKYRIQRIKRTEISCESCIAYQITEKYLYQKMKNGPCAILLPAQVCKANLFPQGRLYEDLFTTYRFFWSCPKTVCVDPPLYFYRDNPDSAMHRAYTPRMFDEIDAVEEIVDFAKREAPTLLPAAYSRKFSAYAQVFRWIPAEQKDEELSKKQDELWKFLVEYRWKMFFDNKARWKNRIGALCTLLGRYIFQRI